MINSMRAQAARSISRATTPAAVALAGPLPSVRYIAPTSFPASKQFSASSSLGSSSTTPAPSKVPTELLTVIEETIKTHGPLPIARYMTLCLAHPTLGYYTTRNVFGSTGDFITSPEISQVFGELLAIWFVTQYLGQSSPPFARIVELGPGRGTLLADILRTFRNLPAHSRPPVNSIHLVENSEALRKIQGEKIRESGFEGEVRWYGSVDEVEVSDEEFTMVVAHEFFDAMPIHIFEHTSHGWREVMVDVADPEGIIVPNATKNPLRLVLARDPTPASSLYTALSTTPPSSSKSDPSLSSSLSFDTTLPSSSSSSSTPSPVGLPTQALMRTQRLPTGSRMEISPASWEVAKGLGRLFQGKAGSAGLVVDYGDDKAFGRSWRGFRKHKVVDPLEEPGHTDLTANVDFSYISECMASDATTHGPISQSLFLNALGLQPRLENLLKNAKTDERKKDIESAVKRLVDKTGMGGQYKVMGITPKKAAETGDDCFPFGVKEV